MRVQKFDGSRKGSPFYYDHYEEIPAAMAFYTYNDTINCKAALIKSEFIIDGSLYTNDGIDELVDFIDTYNFDATKKLVVFCTGLDTLYQFIKNYFDDIDTFSPRDKGVAVMTIDKLEFREIITVAGNDWLKLVASKDAVNELGPVNCAYLFAHYYYENIMFTVTKEDSKVEKVVKLPVTMQQIIQTEISKNRSAEYKEMVKSLMPKTANFYKKIMTHMYIGGFCDKNPNYYNDEGLSLVDLRDCSIGHIDFKTSYISRMLTDYYPITRFEKSKNPEADLEDAIKSKCCIIECTCTNFRSDGVCRFLPKSKAVSISDDCLVNNVDKILSCSSVTFMLTELDFELLLMFYKADTIKIDNLWTSERGELPYELRRVAHIHYYNKENLEKNSANQLLEKWLTEIIYGATCKKLYDIDNKNWTTEIVERAILSPYWGIWTTSHARYALLTFIKILDNDFLYSDTDSIFFRNPIKYVQLISKYNDNVMAKNKLYCYEHENETFLLKNNAFIKLGTFTYEDNSSEDHFTITDFISSGPKSYIYVLEDDTIITKVAGYKKQYLVNGKLETAWIRDFGHDKNKLFNAFANPTTKLEDLMLFKCDFDEPCEIIYEGKIYTAKSYRLIGEKRIVMTKAQVMKSYLDREEALTAKAIAHGCEKR